MTEVISKKAISNFKCLTVLKNKDIDKECCEIIEGLYLSSLKAALCKEKLLNLGITHILSIMDDIEQIFPNVSFLNTPPPSPFPIEFCLQNGKYQRYP